jgi:hypothetical protein
MNITVEFQTKYNGYQKGQTTQVTNAGALQFLLENRIATVVTDTPEAAVLPKAEKRTKK